MSRARLSLALLLVALGCGKHVEPAGSAPVGSAAAPLDAAAPGDAAAPAATGCPAGHTLFAGPRLCVALPAGYVEPLDQAGATSPDGGTIHVMYASASVFGTVTIIYTTLPPSTPRSWTSFEEAAPESCNAPTKLEVIARGNGRFFSCAPKQLAGNTRGQSRIYTARNVIDCQTISDHQPDIEAVCKTLAPL